MALERHKRTAEECADECANKRQRLDAPPVSEHASPLVRSAAASPVHVVAAPEEPSARAPQQQQESDNNDSAAAAVDLAAGGGGAGQMLQGERMQSAIVPIVPLSEDGFDSAELDLLASDLEIGSGAALGERLVPRSDLEAASVAWINDNLCLDVAPNRRAPSSLMDTFIAKVISAGSRSQDDLKRTYDWLKSDLAPVVGASVRVPDSFAAFSNLLHERDNFTVKTQITTNPALYFHHMPLLQSSKGIIADPRTVHVFRERHEFNPTNGRQERAWHEWIDGEKMKALCGLARGQHFVAFSLFYDDTSVSV
jgi:hypothetical protein